MNKFTKCVYGAATLSVLLIASCARVPNDWHGLSSKRLFRTYGYPTRIARLSKGNCLLIYRRKTSTCTASFTVNKQRRITKVSYLGGTQCAAEFRHRHSRT